MFASKGFKTRVFLCLLFALAVPLAAIPQTNSISLANTHVAGVNLQTGTSYTILAGDRSKLVSFNNASAIAVTLPQAGTTGFPTGFMFWAQSIGAGTTTITPTTSTIDGQSSLALTQYQGTWIVSNGTNWYTDRGTGGTGTVSSIATTSPITGGPITGSGTIACATCVTASAPGAGVAHFAGGTQAETSSAVVESDITTANNTTNNVSSTKHGFAPISPADATKFLNGAATPAYAQVKDSDLSTSAITTNDVSTSKHGFAPTLDNNLTHFLNGQGGYTSPAGTSGAPSYCPNMPTTANRRTLVWMSNGSATTGNWLGSNMSTSNGAANHSSENTGTVPSAPDYVSYTSSASLGAAAGIATPVSFTMGDTSTHKANLYACVRARLNSATSTRDSIGFIDNAHHWPFTNQCQHSFFASSQTMAITVDTLNGDTKWGVVTDNGNATPNFNLNLSSVLDTSWHWFEIVMDDSVPNASFYFDGTLLSTETTKIPAAGQQFEFNHCSEATTGTASRLDVGQIVIQSNYP